MGSVRASSASVSDSDMSLRCSRGCGKHHSMNGREKTISIYKCSVFTYKICEKEKYNPSAYLGFVLLLLI